MLREIKEETGLNAKIIKKGKLFQKSDRTKGKHWVIIPFLCKVKSKAVKLDHENAEFRWVDYSEVKSYPTVPGLEKDLKVLGLK